jgi:predicted PurR-regulated permease PerM
MVTPTLPVTRRADLASVSQFERVLTTGAHLALVFIGCIAVLIVMMVGQAVLAPVCLAMVIGLMFGPIADWCEARGVPSFLSAAVVVLLLVFTIALAVLLFAVPLSEWIGKAPEIWSKLQIRLASLKQPLESIGTLQSQIAAIFGGPSAINVRVADGSTVTNLALVAPEIGAQVLLCLASLYFFIATRHRIQQSVLSLCVSRRMRWRAAHVFGDVESKVSRFLISVTILNFAVGVVVAATMWLIGMPSPLLWGALAFALNYTPYVGQAVMVLVLLSVSFATQSDWGGILLPVGCYLVITFLEGQLVTPQILGHTMTLNPFLILLSATFWLWAWGPVGGFIAVPSLLILQSTLEHVLPGRTEMPRKRIRRTANMSPKDVVLANAAQLIKEKAEAAAKEEEEKRLAKEAEEAAKQAAKEEAARQAAAKEQAAKEAAAREAAKEAAAKEAAAREAAAKVEMLKAEALRKEREAADAAEPAEPTPRRATRSRKGQAATGTGDQKPGSTTRRRRTPAPSPT